MKILELCTYSAGICGVFARVEQESILLAKDGHEVKIFSSNITKGTNEIAQSEDNIGDIEISRFHTQKLGGESFMSWHFESDALAFEPDVIIAHSYRHLHTTRALKVAEKLRKRGHECKVFLVTHAPFERERSFFARYSVKFYDRFIAPSKLNKFDKIIAISHWEIPYLEALGAQEDKIVYIPNGIPEEFFSKKPAQEENKMIFLGRIAPIKNIGTIISAIPLIKNKKVMLEIVGPAEVDYLEELKNRIIQEKLESRIRFSPAIYDINEKIEKLDSGKIFILPSKTEGMPQSLIEAMAREKIVIASDNLGSRDLIRDGKNGYLFEVGSEKRLAAKINLALSKSQDKIREEAKKSVEQFSWNIIIKQIEDLISSQT